MVPSPPPSPPKVMFLKTDVGMSLELSGVYSSIVFQAATISKLLMGVAMETRRQSSDWVVANGHYVDCFEGCGKLGVMILLLLGWNIRVMILTGSRAVDCFWGCGQFGSCRLPFFGVVDHLGHDLTVFGVVEHLGHDVDCF